MVYLLFKLKDIKINEGFGSPISLSMEIKDLKVYWKEEELIDKVGSFGSFNTSVKDIKRIVVSDNILALFIGFKLDPNFTFKASVNKSPEWLCAVNRCVENNIGLRNGLDNVYEDWLDFANYGITFDLIEHPLSDEKTKEVKELKELINNYSSRSITKTKESLENLCKFVENNHLYQNYKKKLNNQQLIKLQENLQKLEEELQTQKVKNITLQDQLVKLQDELDMEREEAEKALDKAKDWRERQIKEINEEKETEIKFLKKELKTYKAILSNYLQSEKEKISELEKQLENLQIQEAKIEISPK